MNIESAIELGKDGARFTHPCMQGKIFIYYRCLHGEFLINEDFEETDKVIFINQDHNIDQPENNDWWEEVEEPYKNRKDINILTNIILNHINDAVEGLTDHEKYTKREEIIFEISNKLRNIN